MMRRKFIDMKKYIVLVTILFGMFFVTGCFKDPLIGEWAIVSDNQNQYSKAGIFKFSADSTITVFENNPVGGTVVYRKDSSKNPIWIEWNGTLGIMRFIDDNTLEIGFNKDRTIPSNNFGQGRIEPATRPVTFENSSYHAVLQRLTQPNNW